MSDSPSEGELLEFLDKLAAFHSGLSPNQQLLLDQMTASMLAEPEVSGFQDFHFTHLYDKSSPVLLRAQLIGLANDPTSTYKAYYQNIAGIIAI
jgi:hypothetical protein